MSFWPYCCKRVQVHSLTPPQDFTNPNRRLDQFFYLTPEASTAGQFCGEFPSLEDNPGKWKHLSRYSGVLEDGTLWVWGRAFGVPSVASAILASRGYGTSPNKPVQVGTDKDWTESHSVTPEFVVAKKGDTLYTLGSNALGHIGIGLRCYDSFPFGKDSGSLYRAKISSPIVSISPRESRKVYSSVKPIIEIQERACEYNWTFGTVEEGSLVENATGGGAKVRCDWKGAVHSIKVLTNGKNYKSIPQVALKSSTNDPNEGGAVAVVTKMSLTTVDGFDSVSGGFGYTYATARETKTGSTAEAIIGPFGSIVGWETTRVGDQTADYLNTGLLSVVVDGDGEGAVAAPALGVSTVLEISPLNDLECWKAIPTVTLSGGGFDKLTAIVKRFEVVAGGSGYTHATVTESLTGSTAFANIGASGRIVSWTMTYVGKWQSNGGSFGPQVTITGDGIGATATAKADIYEPVEQATAQAERLRGSIADKLVLEESGSGYSQGAPPHEVRVKTPRVLVVAKPGESEYFLGNFPDLNGMPVADVTLGQSGVVAIETRPDSLLPTGTSPSAGVWGHDFRVVEAGKVLPFEFVVVENTFFNEGSPGYGPVRKYSHEMEAFVVGPGGRMDQLSKETLTGPENINAKSYRFFLEEPLEGYDHTPNVILQWSQVFSIPADKPFGYDLPADPDISFYSWEAAYQTPLHDGHHCAAEPNWYVISRLGYSQKAGDGWPVVGGFEPDPLGYQNGYLIDANSVTVAGKTFGGTADYEVIDGRAVQSQESPSKQPYNPPHNPPPTWPDGLGNFVGNQSYRTQKVTLPPSKDLIHWRFFGNWYTPLPFVSGDTSYSRPPWRAPSVVPQKTFFHFEDHCSEGDPAYGESVAPVAYSRNGIDHVGATQVTVIEGGSGYTTEPTPVVASNYYISPVAVGDFISVSLSMSLSGVTVYAIDQSQDLFWWGTDSTNVGAVYQSEDQIGFAIEPEASPARYGQSVSLETSFETSRVQGVDASRIYISAPDTGSFPAIAGNCGVAENGYGGHAIQDTKSPSKNTFFACTSVSMKDIGLGYTATPTVTFLKCGNTAAYQAPTAKLIGPSKFLKVVEDVGLSIDGNWYRLSWNGLSGPQSVASNFPVGPQPILATSAEIQEDWIDEPPFYHRTAEIKIVDSKTEPLYVAHVVSGGSEYKSIDVKFEGLSHYYVDTSTDQSDKKSPCTDHTGAPVEVVPHSTTKATAEIKIAPSDAVSLMPPAVREDSSLQSWTSPAFASATAPTISVTGDGSGAVVAVTKAWGFESHEIRPALLPVSVGGSVKDEIHHLKMQQGLSRAMFVANEKLNWCYSPFALPYQDSTYGDCSSLRGVTLRNQNGSLSTIAEDDYSDHLAGRVSTPIRPLSIFVDNHGAKYDSPPVAEIEQPDADARATFDVEWEGRLAGVAVIDGGSGYTEPPLVSTDGGEEFEAVIAGPVVRIDITDPGKGYLYPPDIVFSRPGIPAATKATLAGEDGVVASVEIIDGGMYRSQPTLESKAQGGNFVSFSSGGTRLFASHFNDDFQSEFSLKADQNRLWVTVYLDKPKAWSFVPSGSVGKGLVFVEEASDGSLPSNNGVYEYHCEEGLQSLERGRPHRVVESSLVDQPGGGGRRVFVGCKFSRGDVDIDLGTITFFDTHLLRSGDSVYYYSNDPIGGLEDGDTYEVIVIDDYTIKLRLTKFLNSNPDVDFTDEGGSGANELRLPISAGYAGTPERRLHFFRDTIDKRSPESAVVSRVPLITETPSDYTFFVKARADVPAADGTWAPAGLAKFSEPSSAISFAVTTGAIYDPQPFDIQYRITRESAEESFVDLTVTYDPTVPPDSESSVAPKVSFIPVAVLDTISIKAEGSGYTEAPTVVIVGGGGKDGKAVCEVWGPVARAYVPSKGAGYRQPPSVQFIGDCERKATAKCTMIGSVDSVSVVNGGEGFDPSKSLDFSITDLSPKGSVSVTLREGGSEYTSPPDVVLLGGVRQNGVLDSLQCGAEVFAGRVVSLKITGGANGPYIKAPKIRFLGGGGKGAKADVDLFTEARGTVRLWGDVSEVEIVNGGSGYSSAPDVLFSGKTLGDTPRHASASAAVSDGKVVSVTVHDAGGMYEEPPRVIFFGGGGQGAAGNALLNYSVRDASVTYQGSGFTGTPRVVFDEEQNNGLDAKFKVNMNYSVRSVVIEDEGYRYSEPPEINLTATDYDGDGKVDGSGAKAEAIIDNYSLKRIVITNRGHHYQSPPEVFLVGGKAGGSASLAVSGIDLKSFISLESFAAEGDSAASKSQSAATATITAPGVNASGVAVIDASVVCVHVTDGDREQTYEKPPVIICDRGSKTPSGATDARLKSRLIGTVKSITPANSLGLYSERTDIANRFGTRTPSTVSLWGSMYGSKSRSTYGGKGRVVPTIPGESMASRLAREADTLPRGGPILEVNTETPYGQTPLDEKLFYHKPIATAYGHADIDVITCLDLAGIVVEPIVGKSPMYYEKTVTGRLPLQHVPQGGKIEHNFYNTSYSRLRASPDFVFYKGTLQEFVNVPHRGSSSAVPLPVRFYDSDDPPEIFIDDETAFIANVKFKPTPSGATLSDEIFEGWPFSVGVVRMQNLPDPMPKLTFRARVGMRGGTPHVRKNPATATAVVEPAYTGGPMTLKSITITDGSKGYSKPPAVFVIGGVDEETNPDGTPKEFSEAKIGTAVLDQWGAITSIPVLEGGAGYSQNNPPEIKIVDQETSADQDEAVQKWLQSGWEVRLSDWEIEYAGVVYPRQVSTSEFVELSKSPSTYRFHPVYDDTGYVECVWMRSPGLVNYAPGSEESDGPKITITPTGEFGTAATAISTVYQWSEVYNDHHARPLLPEREKYE